MVPLTSNYFLTSFFDLVMTPKNEVKLSTIFIILDYESTLIFHGSPYFHIMLSRSYEVITAVGCAVLLKYGGASHLWGLRLCGNQCDEIHLVEVICLHYSVIAEKQKGFWFESLHHAFGMSFGEAVTCMAAGNS